MPEEIEMTKVALLGAGGKMGVRLATNLARTDFHVAHVELSPAGQARLKAETGLDCVPQDTALDGAQVVILAVPDTVIGKVAAAIVPTLAPGDIVVMDNLPVHKAAGVRLAIEHAGAELRYLPPAVPTSPDRADLRQDQALNAQRPETNRRGNMAPCRLPRRRHPPPNVRTISQTPVRIHSKREAL